MKPKKIAFTDLEMTGLDPLKHEIIEFGLVVADEESLEILARYDQKVKPEHIEAAQKEALGVAGYKEEDWKDAISLKDALAQYFTIDGGSILGSASRTIGEGISGDDSIDTFGFIRFLYLQRRRNDHGRFLSLLLIFGVHLLPLAGCYGESLVLVGIFLHHPLILHHPSHECSLLLILHGHGNRHQALTP